MISFIAFFLIKLAPGDPVQAYVTPRMSAGEIARIRHSLGLDQPLYCQYFYWLGNTLRGDFGFSLVTYRPVAAEILDRLPATVGLTATALAVATVLGCAIGLAAGANRNRAVDHIVTLLCYLGISLPSFWLAMLLLYIFPLKLGLLPSIGMRTAGVDSALDIARHAVLPCTVLIIHHLAIITRYIRENTVTQLRANYVTTAVAKGLPARTVLFRHILKNALLPVITILGLSLPQLVSGAFITETIFGWPGMGRLGVNEIGRAHV